MPQGGRLALGQDGNAVEALLPMPDGIIARAFDLADRQRVIGALQLLQAGNVRLLSFEIFEQARHARANSIDVEGDEFHALGISRINSSLRAKRSNPANRLPRRYRSSQ